MNFRSTYSRTLFMFAIIAGGCCFGSTAVAQTKVVLIDVGLIFKSHPQFSTELNALKAEADNFKVKSQQDGQALAAKKEKLRAFIPGTEDFKNLEKKLAQEQAAFSVEQNSILRELMNREAKLHYDTYQQVTKVIGEYCKSRNIQLVLRYNSEKMDPSLPNSIMEKVNGNVVYYLPQKDVTAEILQQIKQLSATANAGQADIR